MKSKIIAALLLTAFVLPGCHREDPRKIQDLRSTRRQAIEKLDAANANGLKLAAREFFKLNKRVPVSIDELVKANLWEASAENPWKVFNEERKKSNQMSDNRVYQIECYLGKDSQAPKKTKEDLEAEKKDAEQAAKNASAEDKKADGSAKKEAKKSAEVKKEDQYHFFINVAPLGKLETAKAKTKEEIAKKVKENREKLEEINKKIAAEKDFKKIEDAANRFFAK